MSLKAVRVQCFGISNGLRTPLSQNIQDTLPLPTPTTLIGILGAALGISRKTISVLYSKFQLGVVGTHLTTFQDLTRIVKYQSRGFIKKESSLLIRENLFNSKFTLWFIPVRDIAISEVYDAFKNPKYALSIGRDDEIVRIDEVKVVSLEEIENPLIESTVVPFSLDASAEIIVDTTEVMIPLISINLPRSFITDVNGIRTPIDFKSYTFIEGYKIQSNRKGALQDGEYRFFPL